MSGRRRISNPLNPSVSVLVKLAKIATVSPLGDTETEAWLAAMKREGYKNGRRTDAQRRGGKVSPTFKPCCGKLWEDECNCD